MKEQKLWKLSIKTWYGLLSVGQEFRPKFCSPKQLALAIIELTNMNSGITSCCGCGSDMYITLLQNKVGVVDFAKVQG